MFLVSPLRHTASRRWGFNAVTKLKGFRCYSEGLHPLPALDQWRATFPPAFVSARERVSIRNGDTAKMVAKSFLGGKSIAAGGGKIIIEAFPGPGALSRAILELPNDQVKKLIILEDYEPYLEYLKPLEAADPRVTVIPMSGYDWDTYVHLEERGILGDIQTVPWESGVHPQLHFITHLPHDIRGEQLIAQFFRNIPDRAWLFKYGRVPMSVVLGQWMWERITAPIGANARCKVGVIAEATAELQNSVRPMSLLPYDDHFHPTTKKVSKFQESKPESRRLGHPMVSVNIIPMEQQIINPGMLDKWDYCLRRLFVLKSTPLKRAISALGPGAESLIKVLTSPDLPPEQHVDVSTPVKKLTVADWASVVRAFDAWPFAPDSLQISDAFSQNTER